MKTSESLSEALRAGLPAAASVSIRSLKSVCSGWEIHVNDDQHQTLSVIV